MDYEQLGVFYLGREVDPATLERSGLPLLYDSSDLTTHAVIVGMTGSGKTGLGIGMIEEAAIDGIPVLAIDPKGDLGNLALTFPELRGSDFAPWVDPRDAERAGRSVEEYAEEQAQAWRAGLAEWDQPPERIARFRAAADVVVYTPGSGAGRPISVLRSFGAPSAAIMNDPDLLAERLSTTVTSLLTLLGMKADPLGREQILLTSILEHAWRDGRKVSTAELVHAVQQPPVKRLGVMDVETVFPAKDRLKLAMALNSLLASPTFEAWTRGEPLDVQSLLYGPDGRARVAVVSVAHLSDAEREFFLSLLLTEVVSWTRSQSGTSSLRALVYIDEIFGFLPPVAEPGTKRPLLTLLKQARAFGVGLVLATQNPVDLDYKALSNAGTWFVGRLQTERDKSRLVDGLTSAAPGAASPTELTELIGRIGKRTFLLHNVHAKAPVLFQTRWAMSYLAGPLTRDQVRQLSQAGPPPQPEQDAGRAPIQAQPPDAAPPSSQPAQPPAPAAPTSADRPFLPPDVPQLFFPAAPGATGVTYFPLVLGAADVHYSSKTYGVDHDERRTLLAELREGVVELAWTDGEPVQVSLESLATEPQPGVTFQPLPDVKLDARSVKGWHDLFQRWLRVDGALVLNRYAPLKLVAEVGESEQEFRLRVAQAAREQRDAEKEKLRKKYQSKIATAEKQLLQRTQAVERKEEAAKQRQLDAVVSVGGTLLSAIFSKRMPTSTKIGTAVRRSTSVNKERSDAVRAAESLQQTRAQLDDINAELEQELAALSSTPLHAELLPLEAVTVKPTTRDVAVRYVGLAWVPHAQGATGRWEDVSVSESATRGRLDP